MLELQFKVDEPTIVYGYKEDVNIVMDDFAQKLGEHCNRIMFIDTLGGVRKRFDSKVYRLYTDKIYDLWTKLSMCEGFITAKKIEALLINSLTLPFRYADELEVMPVLHHLLRLIDSLSKKYHLVTIVGNSPYENANVTKVSDYLMLRGNMIRLR